MAPRTQEQQRAVSPVSAGETELPGQPPVIRACNPVAVSIAAKPGQERVGGGDPGTSHLSPAGDAEPTKIAARKPRRLFAFEPVAGRGDAEIERLARHQHGCVHRMQLYRAGIGRNAIQWRLRQARLFRIRTNVFLVGRQTHEPLTLAMAVVLEYKGCGVLGGESAGFLWGLCEQPSMIFITTAGERAHSADGVKVRSAQGLTIRDVRWRHEIPLTSPARTLIDLAATLGPYELENALAQAKRTRLVKDREIMRAIDSVPRNTKGLHRLREMITDWDRVADTRSGFERKLLKLIREFGLPEPLTNVPVAGHLVDMYWPEHHLVVEFDSWSLHNDRHSFETDRRRDQDAMALNLRTLRITARQLNRERNRLAVLLARATA